MRYKILLSILPLFFFLLSTEAAIFVTDTSVVHTKSISSSTLSTTDAHLKKNKPSHKTNKLKKEKAGKVDNFAKWGFISAVTGFISLFFLPFLSLALLPVGVGLSIAGLSAVNRNKTRGKGLAIAGLSIGSAGIFLMLVAVVLVLTLVSNWGG